VGCGVERRPSLEDLGVSNIAAIRQGVQLMLEIQYKWAFVQPKEKQTL
jgi:hypothetical protein